MSSDDVTIGIKVEYNADEANQGFEQTKESLQSLNPDVQKVAGSWKENISRAKEAGEEYQATSSPIRAISWDLLLTGRSLSIMNTGLLGNNETFKTAISLLYSVAAAARLVVMAYDFQRVAAERASNAGYMSTHYIPKKSPFDVGAEIRKKRGVGRSGGKAKTTAESTYPGWQNVKYAQPTVTQGYKPDFNFVGKPYYSGGWGPSAKDFVEPRGATKREQQYAQASARSAAGAGVVEPLVHGAENTAVQGGINMAVGALGQATKNPSMWETLSKMAPFLLAAFDKGGVIPKDMPIYAHKGEAVVREKDYHAINQILQSFNQPLKSSVNGGAQSSVALPKNSQTVNNGGNDARNFTNINVSTGPISSNVDVKNMIKKMAQAQIVESRRRNGQ